MKIRCATLLVILLGLHPFSIACEQIEEPAMEQVRAVIHEYLGVKLEDVRLKLLTGGYSATSIKLDVLGKSYVVRVISALEPSQRVNTELYAMKQAAAAGVAPAIHWISEDGHTILMDYIAGGTLTIKEGKQKEVIAQLTNLLKKVHALSKNPFNAPSFEEHMEHFYRINSQGSHNLDVWDAAILYIREGSLKLKSLRSPSVTTHGDLNPRNILVSAGALYFIDWSEGTYTEPFHDLAYFSILMDYSPSEDALLLQSYLGRDPTIQEKQRFYLARKMNFARLALGALYIGNKLGSMHNTATVATQAIQEWSYYAKTFANTNGALSSQFFWDLAQCALKCAKTIDID